MKSPDLLLYWNKRWAYLLVLALLPLLAFSQEPSADTQNTTEVNVRSGKDRSVIQIRRDGASFEVEHDGYITLSDDDRDVVAISAGGYLKISKSAFGSKRRIQIEADRNGNLIRKYYEGWSQKDYEPAGRAWLAEVLPEIVRSSTLGAEDRVNRIYGKGGMNAFANEVQQQLEGDYTKTAYIKLVMCKKLTDAELDQVLRLMGKEVKSDYYLASLLSDNYSVLLANPARIGSFVDASRGISSDHYMTEVLQKVVTSKQISDQHLGDILSVASSIQSDHYLSSLLIDLMQERELTSNTLSTILKVSRQIQSDHYMSEVLRKALRQDNLSSTATNELINAIGDIQSDHYAKEVILAMETNNMSQSDLVRMLDLLRREIQSDHYLGESLRHLLRKQDLQGQAYTAFLQAASSISSDNYSSEVFQSLAREKRLSDDQLSELLLATGSIQSDHYLSEVLVSVASEVRNRGEGVKAAYRTAAKNISSESYYGRAMRAID